MRSASSAIASDHLREICRNDSDPLLLKIVQEWCRAFKYESARQKTSIKTVVSVANAQLTARNNQLSMDSSESRSRSYPDVHQCTTS